MLIIRICVCLLVAVLSILNIYLLIYNFLGMFSFMRTLLSNSFKVHPLNQEFAEDMKKHFFLIGL